MRATVTTPAGERFEGVTGDLLTYYLGEAEVTPGYQVVKEPDEAESFPQVWQGGVRVDQSEPEEIVGEPVDPEPDEIPPEQAVHAVDLNGNPTDLTVDPDPADAPPA